MPAAGLGGVGSRRLGAAARGSHTSGVARPGRGAAAHGVTGLALARRSTRCGRGPHAHHPLVLGAAAAAAGATPSEAALLAVHHLIGGACTAAVRLLGLDPIAVAAVAAEAGRVAEPFAADAAQAGVAAASTATPALLPTDGSPLYDVLAQLHRSTEATLFAS